MSKFRSLCFTFNNYQTHLPNIIVDTSKDEDMYLFTIRTIIESVKYICFGYETGENGTPHLQGCIEFNNPRSFTTIQKKIPAIHWEKMNGNWDQAIMYCMKGEQPKDEWIALRDKGPNFGLNARFVEHGVRPQQGKRNDLVELKDTIIGGTRVDSIVIDKPNAYHQYGRTLNKIEDLTMRKRYRSTMTKGTWYWGATGVGKSHKAFEGYTPETHYVWTNDKGWWDAYAQQPTVIINDFRGEIPYNMLLQIVDKYPLTVPRRNREPLPFISEHVIVTSSLSPENTFWRRDEEDSIEQLLRRFNVINLTEYYINDNNRNGTEVVGGVILSPPINSISTDLPVLETPNKVGEKADDIASEKHLNISGVTPPAGTVNNDMFGILYDTKNNKINGPIMPNIAKRKKGPIMPNFAKKLQK